MKCSIQKNGRLGFNTEAISKLELKDNAVKYARFAKDSETGYLYIVISSEITKDGLKIFKAGKYYYINTKWLWDDLGFEYIKNKLSYLMIKETDSIYMLKKEDYTPRKVNKKKQ